MAKNSFKTWLEIDSKKILSNLTFFRKKVGNDVWIMTVVKANAYGHGLLEIANILKKEKNLIFGVDSIDEALALKKFGIKNPIMILGFIPSPRFYEAVKNNFHISVYNPETLKDANKFSKGQFHLKVETGTNRLGLRPEELKSFSKIPKFVGIYTHFADSENKSSTFYKIQLTEFRRALAILKSKNIFPKFVHTASTAGILRDPATHFNTVRLGIGLYNDILTWKTKIAQLKNVRMGETIGYDRAFKAKKPMKIAILPVGYYDGYDRKLSNKGTVSINDKKGKIVGRVCMNMTMADVSEIKNIKVGDEVTLLDGELKVDDIAKKINTIDYEIFSRLSSHLPRIIV